jgi:hypothetical protein
MDHAAVLLSLSIAVLLTGCGDSPTPPEAEGAQGSSPTEQVQAEGENAAADLRNFASATLGPIRYRFDPRELIMAEVFIQVPPGGGEQLWGAKLIPIQRADLLGQDRCQYGETGRTETCEAQKEAGLVLALLERPLEHYREAFQEKGLGDELSPAQLDGSRGFSFTAEAEGSDLKYHFLPLRDRTILLARQFVHGHNTGGEAMQEVVRSVAEELEKSHS